MLEAADCSEASVVDIYKSVGRHISDDNCLHR